MNTARIIIGGISALALGAVLVGLSFSAPHGVTGQVTAPCGVEGQVTCTPITIVRSATPTFTVTVLPSSTPVPPTQAPPTVAPPTATHTPAAGSGGQAVVPPSTGAGPDSGSSVSLELLLAGAALAVVGGGSVVVAARKRR